VHFIGLLLLGWLMSGLLTIALFLSLLNRAVENIECRDGRAIHSSSMPSEVLANSGD